MKKWIEANKVRHISRIVCALLLAACVNHYLHGMQQLWLPLTTLLVMLTTIGSALYQGLLRFFLLAIIILIGSLLFSPFHLLYTRMYDVTLGALIGIAANLLILPDRVDIECRTAFIPILQSYANYFSAITKLLLQRDAGYAENEKTVVEQGLQKLPEWIYESGFDVTLQKGYRYFFMKVGHIGEILFAMHHLARYPFLPELLEPIREPLLRCVARVEQYIAALVSVLELKKLSEGVVDFADELAEIEKKFKALVPPALELIDIDKDYVYLTEFIYDLRDLHAALMRLAEALR